MRAPRKRAQNTWRLEIYVCVRVVTSWGASHWRALAELPSERTSETNKTDKGEVPE